MIQRKYNNLNTALACIKSNAPTIAKMHNSFGLDWIEAYIEAWIINLRMFLSVGKSMTDDQTRDTAMIIVATFPNLNVADINLIFKNIKLGRLGKIYDRLDGQVLLQIFDTYFAERCNEAADQSIREAESMSVSMPESPARLQKIVDLAMPKGKFGK